MKHELANQLRDPGSGSPAATAESAPRPARSSLCLAVSIATLLAAAGPPRGAGAAPAEGAASASATPAEPGREPLRLREVFVPYEEFLRRTRQDPNGVVMNLREYRDLLYAALGRAPAESEAVPPVQAVATRAVHTGQVRGHSMEIESLLQVRAAARGWVLCDLGPRVARPGRILVDGEPGWVISMAPSARPGSPRAKKKAEPEHSFLLVRGPGTFSVEILHSLPASEEKDVWTVKGPLPRASTARLTVRVPGPAEGSSDPPFTRTAIDEAAKTTSFEIAVGDRAAFSLRWQPRRATGENTALLGAEHRLTLLPRPANPTFRWSATVSIRRREADRLEFVEPAGMSVIQVTGPRVHSWDRDGKRLRVYLSEPLKGDVTVTLDGLLEPAKGPEKALGAHRFAIAGPRLAGAYSNRGYVSLGSPAPERLEVTRAEGATEVAPTEAGTPELEGVTIEKAYSFPSPALRLDFRALPRPGAFEVRTACLARFDERSTRLSALFSVHVLHGRLYRLRIATPSPWGSPKALDVIAEKKGAVPRMGIEVEERAEARTVTVEFERAVAAEASVDLRLQLDDPAFAADPQWGTGLREVLLGLPRIEGAERQRIDLAISVASSIDLVRLEQAGWTTLGREELEAQGLDTAQLVAGLSTRSGGEPLRLEIRRLEPRGEYRAVSHLLALERAVRLRTDIRLGIVDRAVEEIRLRVPVDAETRVAALGPDIKETVAQPISADQSVRIVRFARPWIGTRQLRIELEREQTPETAVAVPSVRIEGNFDGTESIAFQTLGAVELRIQRGTGLAPTDLEQLPAFSEPWKEGRRLFAYRFRSRGDPGTYTTRVHDRAKVQSSMARELELTTVIDSSGISRTRAEFLLAYADREYGGKESLGVELPESSRLLAVDIDDEPRRRIQPDGAPNRWSIPLPPRSHARIVIVWERPHPASLDPSSPRPAPGLSAAWGTWSESGLRLEGVPVGVTTWKIYHPEGYRFFVTNRDLTSSDPAADRRLDDFASSFFGRIFSGHWPLITSFRSEEAGRPLERPKATVRVASPGAAGSAAQGAPSLLSQNVTSAKKEPPPEATTNALVELLPEGHLIELSKVGGAPRVVLEYRSLGWGRFAGKTVFLLAIVAGCWLRWRYGRRALRRYIALGLLYGTLVPPVLGWLLGWSSPFLFLPFCEGVLALLVLSGAMRLLEGVTARRRARRGTVAATASATTLLVAVLAAGPLDAGPLGADEPWTFDDTVLVPYDPGDLSNLDDPLRKVYVPEAKFQKLWKLAHPDAVEPVPSPLERLPGNASYSLTTEGPSYRIEGRITLRLLHDRWTSWALPFASSSLSSVRLDGKDIGVLQQKGKPVLALRGRGVHRLEVRLEGKVERQPGIFRIATQLLPGAATRLEARLPAGARLVGKPAGGAALISEGESATSVRLDLAKAASLDLRWNFPGVAGQSASRIESLSVGVLSLTLDGYRVDRRERIDVKGQPAPSAEYEVLGDWRILDVEAPELSQWSVEESDGHRVLKVFFTRAVSKAELRLRGWARLGGEPLPLATLALRGGARQESFIGLRHDARRKWAPAALSGAPRASRSDLVARFPAAAKDPLDRIHHVYGSAQALKVEARPVEAPVQLTTELVAVLEERRLFLSARTRYRVAGSGPFRQEVSLPGGWEVRKVRGAPVRDWELRPPARPGGPRTLEIRFSRRARTGDEVIWAAELALEAGVDSLSLPALRTLTADQTVRAETQLWAIASADAILLSPTREEGHVPLRLAEAPTWVRLPPRHSYRFAYRSSAPSSSGLEFRVESPSSLLGATVVQVARLTERYVHVNSRLLFRINRAGRDRFRFRLPPGVEVVSIETRNQKELRRVEDEQGTEVELTLISAVLGEQVVDIAYRIARSSEESEVALSALAILDGDRVLEGVDRYIGVLETGDQLISARSEAGLAPIPAARFPYLPEGVEVTSLQPTFRTGESRWRLVLGREAIESVSDAARIDMLEIVSVVAGDGTLRSHAVFTLRSRELQFLEVELPPDATLWGVTLGGRPVLVSRPREAPAPSGSLVQIPVQHVGASDLDLEVAIVYAQPIGAPGLFGGSLTLAAPRVHDAAMKVRRTLWRVELPGGYSVGVSDSNMEQVATSIQYATKVENLIGQIQRLNVTYEKLGDRFSTRQRVQTERNLQQLQLTLSDNVEDLERTVGAAGQGAPGLDTRQLREQVSESLRLLEKGRKAKSALEAQQKAQVEQQEQAAPVDRQEQGFAEGYQFLENDWFDNKIAPPRKERARPPGKTAGIDLSELRGEGAFRGFRDSGIRLGGEDVQSSVARAVGEKRGLAPLPERTTLPSQPALETPPPPTGATRLTFRRQAGGAQIVLRLTPENTWPRAGFTLLLVLVAGLHIAWRLKKRAEHATAE